MVIVVIKKDMTWAGFVVVGPLVRCMVRCVVVFVRDDFLFLLWRSWSERGLGIDREKAIFLQFFKLQLYPVMSAVDVLHSVIVVDEGGAGIRPIKHPVPCTFMAKVSFPGAVVAVDSGSTRVFSTLLHRSTCLGRDVILSPDFWTSIKEVPRHAAAMALFVPVRSLAAGIIEVPRQAAVVAVFIGTFTRQVAWGATKEAGQQLFGLRAVLGEMSGLVAVSTMDVLASIVSV